MSAQVIAPRSGKVVTVGVAVACAAAGTGAWPDPLDRVVLVLVLVLAWAVYWRPAVTVDDVGVEVRNVLRTVHVPWAALQGVATQYALTLVTEQGPVKAWAAPAPGAMSALTVSRSDLKHLPASTFEGGDVRPGDDPSSDSGIAALVVRRGWERWLAEPDAQDALVEVRWHRRTLVVLGVLAVASLVALAT